MDPNSGYIYIKKKEEETRGERERARQALGGGAEEGSRQVWNISKERIGLELAGSGTYEAADQR